MSGMRHFTFADVGLQIRSRKGMVLQPRWYCCCVALLLSDRRAAICHCAASGRRSRVINFPLRFELLGGTIVRRLGV